MMVRRVRGVVSGLALAVALAGCAPTPPTGGGTATTTAPPTTTTTPPTATWQSQMLSAVNAQRSAAGAPAVSMCASLGRAAQGHSADQAAMNQMSHTGSDGSTMTIRVERAGYRNWFGLAENVAGGYTSVAAVMDGWMNSSGHRTNILNASYAHVGFGLATSASGVRYWTQNFGRNGTC